jgi:lipid-A-disaccharide synthase
MKFYIIAGEASGDLHGSNLIKELKKLDADANIRCWGGDKMQEAGGTLVKHYRELAFMGFTEVLMNLRTIFRNLKFCKEDILQFKPDALILIDYPGFNLRIAKWARKMRNEKLEIRNEKVIQPAPLTAKIIYYISPQVWAWKENRVKMMKECIDKMIVILPFEKDYYKNKWNWEVEYVGHPLVEVVSSQESRRSEAGRDADRSVSIGSRPTGLAGQKLSDKPIIALLPGSRKQEIAKKLPVMLEVSKNFPGYQFIIAQAPSVDESFYKTFAQGYNNVSTVKNQTYNLLLQAKAALVTSGTATLETALFGVPEVVCYKGSFLSYQIGKRLVHVKFISLVNLIMDKMVVKELIQSDLTIENLEKELTALLTDEKRIATLKNDYAALKDLLGQEGNASAKAVASITNFLRQ